MVRMGGQFLILHIKYEPPTRPRTLSKVGSGGAGGQKAFKRGLLWSKPRTWDFNLDKAKQKENLLSTQPDMEIHCRTDL